MSQYPQINSNYNSQNINAARPSYQLNDYIDPNTYTGGPTSPAPNQNYPSNNISTPNAARNNTSLQMQNYEPQYGWTHDGRPAVGYNDPNH